LLDKPHLVVANKIDAVDDPSRVTALEKRAKKLKLPFFRISGVTREGTRELIEAAWPIIAAARADERRAIELAKQEEEERVVAADYNPALVEPVRKSKPKKHR
jgi:GTP-binding protein